MAEVFVAWLKKVDQPPKPDDYLEPILKALVDGDVASPRDLLGLCASDFATLLASPGKRAFLSRAIDLATKEFGTPQVWQCFPTPNMLLLGGLGCVQGSAAE